MIRPKTKLELEIEAQEKRGILLVVSGPSAGVGKDAIVKGLREKYPFERVVTCTTRGKRPGEIQGKDYDFISKEEFEIRIRKGYFLEWVKYLDNYYGTPKKETISKMRTGKDVLLRIEVRGAKVIKEALPETVLVYIAPPSFETLEKRMEKRNDDTGSIARKLQVAVWEIEQFDGFDYVVVNEEGKLDQTIEYVKMIVEAERRKARNH